VAAAVLGAAMDIASPSPRYPAVARREGLWLPFPAFHAFAASLEERVQVAVEVWFWTARRRHAGPKRTEI